MSFTFYFFVRFIPFFLFHHLSSRTLSSLFHPFTAVSKTSICSSPHFSPSNPVTSPRSLLLICLLCKFWPLSLSLLISHPSFSSHPLSLFQMCEPLSPSLPLQAPPCVFSSSPSNWVVNAVRLGAGHAVKLRFPEGQVVIILFLQRPWMDRGVCAGWGRMLGGRGPRQRIALAINIGQLLSSVPGVPGRREPRHLGPALQRWPWCCLQEAARRGPGPMARGGDRRTALLEHRGSSCFLLGPGSTGGPSRAQLFRQEDQPLMTAWWRKQPDFTQHAEHPSPAQLCCCALGPTA